MLVLLIFNMLQICFLNKEIFVQFDFISDDQITSMKMGSETIEVHDDYYSKISISFIGKIGATITMNVLNIKYEYQNYVGIAGVFTIGTSTFSTTNPDKGWSGYRVLNHTKNINGTWLSIYGEYAPEGNYMFTFKIPDDETYCSNKYINGSTVIAYGNEEGIAFIDFSQTITPIGNSLYTFNLTQYPHKGRLYFGSDILSLSTEYDYQTIYYKPENGYGADSFQYIAMSNGQNSTTCEYNIIICYPSCKRCNDGLTNTNDDNHNCLTCIDNYAPIYNKLTNCLNTLVDNAYFYYNAADSLFYPCDVSCKICQKLYQCITCNIALDYYFIDGEPDNCYQKETFLSANTTYFLSMADTPPVYRECYQSCAVCAEEGIYSSHKCQSCKAGYYTHPNDVTMCCDKYWITHIDGTNICVDNCNNDFPFLNPITLKCISTCPFGRHFVYQNTCYNECPSGTLSSGECYQVLTDEQIFQLINDLLKDIDENILYLKEVQSEYISDSYKYQISDTINNDQNNKFPILDLDECLSILKHNNNIPPTENLIVFAKNSNEENTLTGKLEYLVYTIRGEPLNISDCQSIPMDIQIPIYNISNEEYQRVKELASNIGVDLTDPEDPFFNDICFVFEEDGKDIPRNDRVNGYLINNATICPEGCKYNSINFDTDMVNCTCNQVNTDDKKDPFQDLKSSLLDSLLNSNWEVVTCYKLVFGVAIVQNIGNWFILGAIILSIVNIIVYIVRNSNPLLQYLYQLYNQSLQAKKQARNNINIKKLIVSNNSSTRMKIIEDKSKIMNYDLQKMNQPQQPPQQPKQYTLDDYNEMNFNELLEKDHRHFFKHYWNCLQSHHPILNTFITNNRKILRSIKISLFLIGIIIDFSLSAFFYSDNYISNNNQNGQSFWYNLPISLYTFLFGSIFTIGLNMLSNIESGVSKIEKAELKHRFISIVKFKKMYTIKVTIFFILQIILMIFFWYYTSAFCAVYKNSQEEWFISGITSTGISQSFPIIIWLVYSICVKLCLKYNLGRFFKVINFTFRLFG